MTALLNGQEWTQPEGVVGMWASVTVLGLRVRFGAGHVRKFSRRPGHLGSGSLFVSWSRPQPRIVQSIPFSPLAWTCTVSSFIFKPALSCGNKLPPLVNTQSRSHGS